MEIEIRIRDICIFLFITTCLMLGIGSTFLSIGIFLEGEYAYLPISIAMAMMGFVSGIPLLIYMLKMRGDTEGK